jgi:hypothetical protein
MKISIFVLNFNFIDFFLYYYSIKIKSSQNIQEVRVMVFNATFNNISVLLWRSALLVEKTRVPREKNTDLPQVTVKLDHIK